MKNPFRFGDVVEDDYFTDREDELADLVSDIRSGQNVILTSKLRVSKTSLVKKALKKTSPQVLSTCSDKRSLSEQRSRRSTVKLVYQAICDPSKSCNMLNSPKARLELNQRVDNK